MKEYIIDKMVLEKNNKMWDTAINGNIFIPEHIIEFMKEYEEICKKYDVSLGHEDNHGAFEFHAYKEDNIEWVSYGHLCK